MEIDEGEVDDAVLALLYLTTFKDRHSMRAWKGHNWDSLDRLHRQGYISDPATKAKSVLLTKDGAKRSQAQFEELFAKEATHTVSGARQLSIRRRSSSDSAGWSGSECDRLVYGNYRHIISDRAFVGRE
jgi:hypothetical protein